MSQAYREERRAEITDPEDNPPRWLSSAVDALENPAIFYPVALGLGSLLLWLLA